jgi:hypothetical protein
MKKGEIGLFRYLASDTLAGRCLLSWLLILDSWLLALDLKLNDKNKIKYYEN